MMRLRLLVSILVVLLIVAGIVWWRWGEFATMELRREKARELMMKGPTTPEQMPQPLGNPNAKVVMVIVAPPFACYNPQLIEVGKELANKYQDKVYTKFTASPPAGTATCIGVVINGKQKFKIGERSVELHGPLTPSGAKSEYGYTQEDIESVLKEEIKKAYGKQ